MADGSGRPANVRGVRRLDEFVESQLVEERRWAIALAEDAERFLEAQHWVVRVVQLWWGVGVADKVGVFFVEVESIEGADNFVWLVVGDLPGAYLVADSLDDPSDVLKMYCALMGEWITAVRTGVGLDEAIPTNVPPTADNADLLERRLGLVRRWLAEGVFG